MLGRWYISRRENFGQGREENVDFVLGYAVKLFPNAPLKHGHLSSDFSKRVPSFKVSKDSLVAHNVLNTPQDKALGAENKMMVKNSLKSSILKVFYVSGKHHGLASLVFLSSY